MHWINPASYWFGSIPITFLPDPFWRRGKSYPGTDQRKPYIHLVEPVALGDLGFYSGEDMPEKSSMMAWSDVFWRSIQRWLWNMCNPQSADCQCLHRCSWRMEQTGKFSLSLSKSANGLHMKAFSKCQAGRVVYNKEQLKDAINLYLSIGDWMKLNA